MKEKLINYIKAIKQLPLKDKYTKENLLIPPFLIEETGNISIYYAPHNEYINPDAKVFIVGITPGFEQMQTAMVAARQAIEMNKSLQEIQYECKVAGRFSGSLRKNIIKMLDELYLPEVLGMHSSQALFGESDALLHTVSLIPYPTFVKGTNYTGHTPKLIKNDFLMQYVRKHFIAEINSLKYKESLLIIPLGRAVEEVLVQLEREGILPKGRMLHDFPHPSGTNVNRVVQFEAHREEMINFIKNCHLDKTMIV